MKPPRYSRETRNLSRNKTLSKGSRPWLLFELKERTQLTTAAELQPENRLPLKMMQKTIWMLLMLMRMRNLRLSLKSSIRPLTDFQ
jgi:hypothetical protein